eukprot:COSAG01_NODE_40327_length_465_cov_0.789617_1_plen_50_part_00
MTFVRPYVQDIYHILTFRAKAEDGDVLVELPSVRADSLVRSDLGACDGA